MSTDEWPIGYQPLDWSDDDGDYVQYGDYTIEAAYDDNDAVVGYYVSWSEDGMREDLGSEDIGGFQLNAPELRRWPQSKRRVANATGRWESCSSVRSGSGPMMMIGRWFASTNNAGFSAGTAIKNSN